MEGIPWKLPMDKFFEAWVETIFRKIAQHTGAQVKVGRKQETTSPINWEPPYAGTQKSLAPDIWLEWDSMTLIVDAKYKRHWEELQQRSWWEMEESLREQHRNDLLQVLAYANLARTSVVSVCLTYPCTPENWDSLRERGRLVHRAKLTVASRVLHLWITAVPMTAAVDRIASPLTNEVRTIMAGAIPG